MINALALALVGFTPSVAPSINDYTVGNLKDATMTASIVRGDQRELKKINDSFGQSYRFKTTTVQFKEPYKLRLETKVDETSILYILNGPIMLAKIPRMKINSKQDLAKQPGRRQTTMDFGLLVPSLFNGSLYQAKYVRDDRATGDVVFDITIIPALDDTSRHRVWIDKTKKYVTKREWYNQEDRQLATFLYENPKNVNGVWLPTQLTVKNVDNKIAGITKYDSIKVNSGLSDSLFSVN